MHRRVPIKMEPRAVFFASTEVPLFFVGSHSRTNEGVELSGSCATCLNYRKFRLGRVVMGRVCGICWAAGEEKKNVDGSWKRLTRRHAKKAMLHYAWLRSEGAGAIKLVSDGYCSTRM